MSKKLDIYNYRGTTEEDNKAIMEAVNNRIELSIDEFGRVYNECGIYIADAVETDNGNGVGCV